MSATMRLSSMWTMGQLCTMLRAVPLPCISIGAPLGSMSLLRPTSVTLWPGLGPFHLFRHVAPTEAPMNRFARSSIIASPSRLC